MDNVDFTNKKIRIQTPHSKSVLLEMGLDEEKLYKISKKEYLDNHPELRQEKPEFQDKRYEHYEKRRQEAIDQARKIRSDILKKESEGGQDMAKTSKYSTTGFKSKNNEDNKNEAQQSGMIKKELEKLELIKKQQLGEIKNLIDYEYSLNETRKKNEQKEKEKEEKEERMRKEKLKQQKLKEQRMKEKEEEKRETKKRRRRGLEKI